VVSYNLEKDDLTDITTCLESAIGPQIHDLILRVEEVTNSIKSGFSRAANVQAANVIFI
jgi:hypothetical protein